MNILARMDDCRDRERIENVLPHYSVNLFYARNDETMLWLAKNAEIEVVVIGIHSAAESVLNSVKALKRGFLNIPYLCFYSHQHGNTVWTSPLLEQACVSYGAKRFILAHESESDQELEIVLRSLLGSPDDPEPLLIGSGLKELAG